MRKNTLILGIILGIFAFAISAYAQAPAEPVMGPVGFNSFINTSMVQPQAEGDYSAFLENVNAGGEAVEIPVNKFGYGTINAVSGWTDIPYEVANTSAEDNILSGVTFGFAKGLATGFTRTAAGAFDVATCGLSPSDQPLMEPEYTINNPQKNGLKIDLLQW